MKKILRPAWAEIDLDAISFLFITVSPINKGSIGLTMILSTPEI